MPIPTALYPPASLATKLSHSAQEAARRAAPRLGHGIETVTPRIQSRIEHVGPALHEGLDAAAPRIRHGLETAIPRLQEGLDVTLPKVQRAADRLSPVVDDVKVRTQERIDAYVPLLVDAVGQAAAQTARKLTELGLPEAAEEKAAVARPRRKKTWLVATLVVVGVAAGAAALVAWRKSREDNPWLEAEPGEEPAEENPEQTGTEETRPEQTGGATNDTEGGTPATH